MLLYYYEKVFLVYIYWDFKLIFKMLWEAFFSFGEISRFLCKIFNWTQFAGCHTDKVL